MNTVIRFIYAGVAMMILSACSTVGINTQCATPTLNPPNGSGPGGQDVRVFIKTSTLGASLRWTDTSPPPPLSQWQVIPAPEGYAITVFGRTMRAMAFKTGLADSPIVQGVYSAQ